MNFAKFLRTPFLTEHLWWLLLLYARWTVDLHDYLKKEKEMIIEGFNSAGISEAVENPPDKSNHRRCSLKKDVFKNFHKIHWKTHVPESLFNEVVG